MERLFISYPEFRLGEIIDPEEANTNNADITLKVNQLVDRLNSLLGSGGGEDGGIIEISIRGNIVKINPIEPFPADNVESFLNELMERLRSEEVGSSGASLVGTPAVEGLSGVTVEDQLRALYDLVVRLDEEDKESSGALLEQHKASGDHDHRYYKKSESDEKVKELTTNVNTALETVTKITEQIAPGTEGVVISKLRVVLEDPVDATTGEIWIIGQPGEETPMVDLTKPEEPVPDESAGKEEGVK